LTTFEIGRRGKSLSFGSNVDQDAWSVPNQDERKPCRFDPPSNAVSAQLLFNSPGKFGNNSFFGHDPAMVREPLAIAKAFETY
jgi:hypothetical protein